MQLTSVHPAASLEPQDRLPQSNPDAFVTVHPDENSTTSLTNREGKDEGKVHEPQLHAPPITTTTSPRTDWGVDTVKLSYDVDPNQSSTLSSFWTSSSSRKRSNSNVEDETYVGNLPFGTGNVRVTLYAQSRICHVEFNAARLAHGKSHHLWPPEGLEPLVEMIIGAVSPYACPNFVRYDADGVEQWDEDWTRQVRFKRLDIARNLTISDPDLVKRVLPSIPCKYGKSKAEYASKNSGWTLVNSTSKSGVDRLYDKEAELSNFGIDCSLSESEGRLFRFEAQLQADRLARHGLACLSNVSNVRAWKALEGRWEATGWGSPLPAPTGLVAALKALPPLRMRRMIGDLHLDAEGLAEGLLTSSQLKTYRREARELGLAPGMPVELLGAPTQYLDLEVGGLVPLTENRDVASEDPRRT